MDRSRILFGLLCLVIALALLGSRGIQQYQDSGPKQVANQFLTALLKGDLETASRVSTTKPTQQIRSLASLSSVGHHVGRVEYSGDDLAVVSARLADSDESIPIRLTLIRNADSAWLVQRVNLLVNDSRDPKPVRLDRLDAIEGVETGTF